MKTTLDLRFVEETTGQHHGQTDSRLHACLDDMNVGRIEFVHFKSAIHIHFITTAKAYRRQGVATAMMQALQRRYPNSTISPALTTSEGDLFFRSLTWRFVPNPVYVELRSRLHRAGQAHAAATQSFERNTALWSAQNPGLGLSEELRSEGEHINDLDRLIWETERDLRGETSGQSFLVLPEDVLGARALTAA